MQSLLTKPPKIKVAPKQNLVPELDGPTKSSDKGGVSLISGGGSGGGGQNMAGVGGGKMLPLIDPAKKISANKIAVLGITV